MKANKRFVAMIMVVLFVTSLFGSAMASGVVKASDEEGFQRITYDQLPDEFKTIVSRDATIYIDDNGNYSIFQARIDKTIQPYAMEKYAPNGGTYSKFKNPYINNELLMINESYVPAEPVLDWAVGTTPGAVASIFAWAAAGETVSFIVAKLAATYGLTIPSFYITGLLVAGQLTEFALFEMNKTQSLEALKQSDSKGIIVRNVTSITTHNFVKLYEPWYNYPYVNPYPNNGTASFESGVYDALF